MIWTPAQSADDTHPDEETAFPDGRPDGASWAYVSSEDGRWSWGVLNAWLWDDAEVIAEGTEETKDAAKRAVEHWAAREKEEES